MNSISPAEIVNNRFNQIVSSVTGNIQCYCSDPAADFTRNRLLTAEKLIKQLVFSESKSIPSELCSFFSENVPSASAFCQQRAKLLPEALRRVFLQTADACMDALKTYDGWSLIACDGSSVNIPDNPNDTDTLCHVTGTEETYNQIHLNAIFDCMSDVFYDCSIDTSKKTGETRALIKMIRAGNYPQKSIFIADRGYENYELMAECLERGQKFIVRLKDIDSNGILSSLNLPESTFDMQIRRVLTRRQDKEAKQNPQLYRFMPWNQEFSRMPKGGAMDYELCFRAVRIQLEDGLQECLATNLDPEQFPSEKLAEIYHFRWNEETGFRKLKYSVGLLSFKSRKRMNIEQEIYGRMTLFNLNSLLILLTEREDSDKGQRKFQYKSCFSTALTNLREFFRGRISGENLVLRLKKYLVPVRPDRKAARIRRSKSAVAFNYRAS